MGIVRIKDGEFVDEYDRVLNLRGVNVGGSSKLPSSIVGGAKDGPLPPALDPDLVPSFVGRPFPLPDAPLHFRRLRACGFTLIRFVITWEAIEHAGPGEYDAAYLDYVRSVLEVASDHGVKVYLDPHQDVWSRWTGGDGAPLWTLQLVGFDVRNLRECEAALCRETYGRGHGSAEKRSGKKFPKMIWPTNYFKLACATMFTLFFAGERFAPHFVVKGSGDDEEEVNIQTYLQTHYINAMAMLLGHLKGLDNIVGVGTMNEPSPGYINVADLSRGFGQSGANRSALPELRYGLAPTPFQGMCLGDGHEQKVGEWSNGFMQHILGRPDRQVTVNPKGQRAWKEGCKCVWERAGVWRTNPRTSTPELLRPDYFANVDFGVECYLPFASRYASAMRSAWSDSPPPPGDGSTTATRQQLLIFVELPPLEFTSTPFPKIARSSLPDAVNATHWYDGVTLFTRSWRPHFSFDVRAHRPVFGRRNVFKMHARQLGDIKRLGIDCMENSPTLVGECGVPYDMLHEKYDGTSSFGPQLAAMDHTLSCLEENLLSFTLWCYTGDNTNEDGDGWNGEDLSLYSPDQRRGLDENHKHYIYDGLRAPQAFVRPYASCVAGRPRESRFELQKGEYRLLFDGNGRSDLPTEIFVPKLWCPLESDMCISVSGGRFEVDEDELWFTVKHWQSASKETDIRVDIQGPMTKMPR